MMMRSGGSKNPKKNNLAPTYEEVREFEPQAPKIDDYFKRSAEDLCATDLRIKRALVDLTVAGSKHILHLRPYFVSTDDLLRFHRYIHEGVVLSPITLILRIF